MITSKGIFFSIILLIALFSTNVNGATFTIRNSCPDPVWAAAVPGGGRHLYSGQTWTFEVADKTEQARIWARTGCSFDEAAKQGHCETGDCNGLVECLAYGTPPYTFAEYSLNQFNGRDFFQISLVEGFNVPMEFKPITGNCSWNASCTADINRRCPVELRRGRGCNNRCTNDRICTQYYSRFFKEMCPNAYSSPKDIDSIFSCPGGTNYEVVFCPVNKIVFN